MIHGKVEPDETFIAAWSQKVPLADTDGEKIPAKNSSPSSVVPTNFEEHPDPTCDLVIQGAQPFDFVMDIFRMPIGASTRGELPLIL
ncbi:hypothetical protein N7465_000073 [Penicillium sp. CMV-2018d]|nr:hypothetical protein N7465_000073 [Penicillium sp. CMV-2018d]